MPWTILSTTTAWLKTHRHFWTECSIVHIEICRKPLLKADRIVRQRSRASATSAVTEWTIWRRARPSSRSSPSPTPSRTSRAPGPPGLPDRWPLWPPDTVLDLFVGSGTTILAAEKVGRRAFAMDIDPKYADVAVRRWQAVSGRDAVHEESGMTFDELRPRKKST